MCPLDCGQIVYGDHESKCPNLKKECEKCSFEYFVNKNNGKEHDCFEDLCKAVEEQKREID